jgi:hypothetical protein
MVALMELLNRQLVNTDADGNLDHADAPIDSDDSDEDYGGGADTYSPRRLAMLRMRRTA